MILVGGLKGSSLVTYNLISHYIPFLPLERSHVKRCIKDDLDNKNFTAVDPQQFTAIVNKVMEQISFAPANTGLYSVSGCKRVFEKVNYILEELYL